MDIRNGTGRDLEDVLRINTQARPGVASLDRLELERLRDIGATLTVADVDGHAAGYLLTFGKDSAYEGEEFRYFKRRFGAFVYVDQIAIDPRYRGQRIATALYLSLLRRPPSSGPICCEVNLSPPNPVSLSLHCKMGFVEIDQMTVHDGRSVVLLVHELPCGKCDF